MSFLGHTHTPCLSHCLLVNPPLPLPPPPPPNTLSFLSPIPFPRVWVGGQGEACFALPTGAEQTGRSSEVYFIYACPVAWVWTCRRGRVGTSSFLRFPAPLFVTFVLLLSSHPRSLSTRNFQSCGWTSALDTGSRALSKRPHTHGQARRGRCFGLAFKCRSNSGHFRRALHQISRCWERDLCLEWMRWVGGCGGRGAW